MTLPKKLTKIEIVQAYSASAPKEEIELSYIPMGLLGKGAFGVVSQAKICHTGQVKSLVKTLAECFSTFSTRELINCSPQNLQIFVTSIFNIC